MISRAFDKGFLDLSFNITCVDLGQNQDTAEGNARCLDRRRQQLGLSWVRLLTAPRIFSVLIQQTDVTLTNFSILS